MIEHTEQAARARERLRPASMSDVPALTRLIERSVRVLGGRDYDPRQVESSLEHVYGVDTLLIADRTYYVIEAATGGPLACGGWSRRRTLYGGDQARRGDDPLLDPATEAARIRAFFVHPDAARRGLGTRLLHHSEREARAAGFRRLELMATLTGEPFYRRWGYAAVERVEHALPDGLRLRFTRMAKELARGD